MITYYLYLSFLRYSRIEKIFCTKNDQTKKTCFQITSTYIFEEKKTHTHKQKMQRQPDCSYF